MGSPAASNREGRIVEAGGGNGGAFIWEGSVLLQTAAGAVADGGEGTLRCGTELMASLMVVVWGHAGFSSDGYACSRVHFSVTTVQSP